MNKEKKSRELSAGELMKFLLSRMNHETDHFAVFRLWDDLAPTYVPRSEALGMQGSKLVIGVPSHAHQHQLSIAKKEILVRINQALGKPFLKEIVFQITPMTRKAERTTNG